ncbi:LysE family translocator [Oligella urethralis]|uniref:LysE family translocator n=1 Tax=Oligella urethralis TaxID=90245 RepID=UPI000DFE2FEC|nr:LysE family translocator [Oligella urethralis]SUA56384.1 Homoserine/homoserine lactone efflux protein [Oligella urethralis]
MTLSSALSFFMAAALLALLPGPDNLYVMAQSMRQGWRIGFMLILGLCSGLVVHTGIVAVGASELIYRYHLVYQAINVFGACYLVYLAYLLFNAGVVTQTPAGGDMLRPRQAYWRGVLMNLSNPKVILFFLSFTQPFIQVENGQLGRQYAQLAILMILATLLVFGTISVFADRLGPWLKQSARAQIIFNRISASILFVLAGYLLINLLIT